MRVRRYQFVVEVHDGAGVGVGRARVTPDLIPAIEWAHFSGIRRGVAPPTVDAPPAEVFPAWHRKLGQPYISGGDIVLLGENRRPDVQTIELDYFKPDAKRAAAAFVETGRLKVGQPFGFRVAMLRLPDAAEERPSGNGFCVEEIPQVLPIRNASMGDFLDRSTPMGTCEASDSDDLPVFVSQALLDKATRRAREAPDIETAGVLLGRLHRDQPGGTVFLELTDHLTARHTEAREMNVTFTPATWSAARAEAERRGPEVSLMAWVHSHPMDHWRKNSTTDERRATCAAGIFFSGDDCALHRAIFSKSWQVALLLSLHEGEIIPTLFSWRRGQIKARPFFLLAAGETPLGSISGGIEHGDDANRTA